MNSTRRNGPIMTTLSRPTRRSPRLWAAAWVATVAMLGPALRSDAAALSLPLLSASEPGPAPGPSAARSLLSAAVRVGETARHPGPAAAPQLWQVPLAFEPADEHAPADADFAARGPGYSVFVGSGGALLALQDRASRAVQADPADAGSDSNSDSDSDSASTLRHRRATAGSAPGTSRLVRLRWDGARSDLEAVAEAPLSGRIHRLRGSDPHLWQTGLQPHGRVRYRNLYPGIDVAYYGHGRELEYDLIVAPGAEASTARLRFDGVQSMTVDDHGNLRLGAGDRELVQRRPVAYQDGPRGRKPVAAAYRVEADGAVGLQVGDYDRSRPLVIDPVLSYATFIGGTGFDQCWDVAVDALGSAFVTGETESPAYTHLRILSTNAFRTNYQGGLANVAGDAFVAKLTPDGTGVEWFTYLGGKDLDTAFTISLAPGGEPVVGGFTTSTNFPLSPGAYQTQVLGVTNKYTGRAPLEAFITRLTADGSAIAASTLYGGTGEEQVLDLALLPGGGVVAVGSTTSSNLPVTGSAAQRVYGGNTDGFVAVFGPGLTSLVAATYLGGSGRDSAEGVALDATAGLAHVVGITASTNFPVKAAIQTALGGLNDAWVAGFSLADLANDYATYLGGSYDDFGYRAAVAPAPAGGLWIVGETGSTNFPIAASLQSTNAGLTDGFLARLSDDGRSLVMATYFGGSLDDALWDVAIDETGGINVAGLANSTSVPGLSTNSLQATNAGLADLVIARLALDGTLASTFYGSVGDELAYGAAVDGAGGLYLAGRARSVVFPVSSTNVAQPLFGGDRADGFVLKIAREPALSADLTATGVEVSWPGPNPGFVLESAALNGGAGVWTREASPVALAAGRHVVRLPSAATNCLFRLRWER